MATNRIETLDPALIRPGMTVIIKYMVRVSYIIDLHYSSYSLL